MKGSEGPLRVPGGGFRSERCEVPGGKVEEGSEGPVRVPARV